MPTDLRAHDEGAALVEAALVLPILLLLVFGIMDVSLYFWNAGLAVKASQLGVRRAVLSDPVAIGPGLEANESPGYWDGLPPGETCFPVVGKSSPCPSFAVTCSAKDGCHCASGACPFRFAAARLSPILKAMQAIMPDLKPGNVEVSYATNNLGYVTRPLPIPVDVRVSLVGVYYTPLFLGGLFGDSLRLRGSALLPSEDLQTR